MAIKLHLLVLVALLVSVSLSDSFFDGLAKLRLQTSGSGVITVTWNGATTSQTVDGTTTNSVVFMLKALNGDNSLKITWSGGISLLGGEVSQPGNRAQGGGRGNGNGAVRVC